MSGPKTLLKHAPLGARIRLARNDTGLSQEAFAEKISTSRRHVMRIERGQHRPTAPMLARIAEVTGVPVSDLLGDDEDEEPSLSFAEALERMLARSIDRAVREQLAIAIQEYEREREGETTGRAA